MWTAAAGGSRGRQYSLSAAPSAAESFVAVGM
jgi:hypothetical protein